MYDILKLPNFPRGRARMHRDQVTVQRGAQPTKELRARQDSTVCAIVGRARHGALCDPGIRSETPPPAAEFSPPRSSVDGDCF
jgi:hypothetical protein